MDKFKALTYFAETAESGSFSVAAKRFGVPASSISRRISDLEADLGAQLLLRSTRSVSLTEIGEQYLLQVNSILQQVKQSEKSVRSYQDQPSGTLKISSMVGFGERVLVPILDEFSAQYPKIVLDVVLSDELSKLSRDDVDIAIRGGYAPDERVIAKRLMDNNFIPVAALGYLEKYGKPQHTFDLKQHQGLFFKSPIGVTPWLSEVNGQWHDVSGLPRLISNNGAWLIKLAIRGEGILMLPQWVLQPYLLSGELIRLNFEHSLYVTRGEDLGIYLLYQKLDYASPKVKAAVDFISKRVELYRRNIAE